MDETRYRAAEQAYWGSLGIQPTEQTVRLEATGTSIRVQEVGEGPPVLFLHGAPNAGTTFAPLVAHLGGFRCLLADRPGTGLSEPFALTVDALGDVGARFVGDVLGGLGLESAHVVASSFGGHLALRSAAAQPDRFERMVQLGAPGLVPGQAFPPFMRLLRFGPVRKLLGALPPNKRANRSILRQIGHGASVDDGRIPEAFHDWYLALGRHTDTARSDSEAIAGALRAIDRAALTPEQLASVPTRTLFLWGEDDAFGGAEQARATTALMPDAELRLFPGFGHLPWLDDPEMIAEAIAAFLSGDRAATSSQS